MLMRTRISIDQYPRRGTVAALVAVLLPVVVGVMALSLDGGLLYFQRQKAQSAADAAALAGAYQLYNGSNFSVAQTAAIAMGAQNGYTIPSSSVTSPQTGYVAVTVTGSQPRLFSAMWGAGTVSVAASAVARGSAGAYSKAALLVLATSGTAVTLSGTVGVTATNGSIVVDFELIPLHPLVGFTVHHDTGARSFGGITYSGSNPNKATVTNTSQPSTSDPLASIAAPSSSGMTVQSSSALNLSSTTTTLNPGVYTGGINMSGSSSVTLNPGVYYINGGGINMSGTSSISGNGVMIYNTGGAPSTSAAPATSPSVR